MFTAGQLVAHAVGDYVLQTDEMAKRKVTSWRWAFLHATCYTLPFLFLTHRPAALLMILCSHAVIDRCRLARYVVWLKEGPIRQRCASCRPWELAPVTSTGYADGTPAWLAVWLSIIVDNLLHVLVNGAALTWR